MLEVTINFFNSTSGLMHRPLPRLRRAPRASSCYADAALRAPGLDFSSEELTF